MQLCAATSQLGRHAAALSHGRRAAAAIHRVLALCYQVAAEVVARGKRRRLRDAERNLCDIAQKNLPTAEFLAARAGVAGARADARPEPRDILGLRRGQQWAAEI